MTPEKEKNAEYVLESFHVEKLRSSATTNRLGDRGDDHYERSYNSQSSDSWSEMTNIISE